MKRLKTILLNLLLALVIPASLSAQTDAERKFLASADSLNTQLLNAYTGKDYPATEALCQKVIDLYDAHASQLAEGYAYFKYSSYYTMASVQAIQGKKQEAVSNLFKALNSNKMEVSYNRVVNDEDLKDILDAPELQPALKRLKETTDYLYILQNAPEYTRTQPADSLPRVAYAQADEPDLKRVRDYFRLDSVAVAGDELTTIKRILTYIHDKIRHDGQNGNPTGGNNSINFAEACKDGSRGLNCRGLATVLNECYLSMGIPSRVITCIGQPVRVNEEANWNNEKKTTTEDYLYEYMAKNLFYLESWTRYGFNTESDYENLINYIFLQPTGCDSKQRNPRNFSVNDDRYFWQPPHAGSCPQLQK